MSASFVMRRVLKILESLANLITCKVLKNLESLQGERMLLYFFTQTVECMIILCIKRTYTFLRQGGIRYAKW